MQTLNGCYELSCLSIAVWVMLLNGREEKDALLKLFRFYNQKSHTVVWPWCWPHQNFFLNALECPWKIPLASWRGAKALNTHASILHLRKQNKKVPDIYILTPFPYLYLITYNLRSKTWMSVPMSDWSEFDSTFPSNRLLWFFSYFSLLG